jgi:hypothetical protein
MLKVLIDPEYDVPISDQAAAQVVRILHGDVQRCGDTAPPTKERIRALAQQLAPIEHVASGLQQDHNRAKAATRRLVRFFP